MAQEMKLTKWHSGVLIDIETRVKVMKKFGTEGGSKAEAITKALEEAVKDVKLTRSELQEIRKEVEENYKKRILRREQKAEGKDPKRSKK